MFVYSRTFIVSIGGVNHEVAAPPAVVESLKSSGTTSAVAEVAELLHKEHGRWKTLQSSYRRGKDLNRQTGKDRKSIEIEDALDDNLLDRHDTTPVYTLSSSSNSQSEEPDSDHESTPSCQREEGDSDSGEPPKKACKTKERRESSATQVINLLKGFRIKKKKGKGKDWKLLNKCTMKSFTFQ
ncbi:hypothetical protein DPMN_001438 [Dreissena polymorpha]|uniref:Uncharacterized protein n=1 Tax=Dreissena polymorpha TaxID=45954 RepID=A0A9D4MIF7_DREPO|nr:hypothetical protein DPMN_001438 [Dreissena polymorpha]